MSPPRKRKLKRARFPKVAARSMPASVSRRASIFRNGANQAVRLPQELRFPGGMKEVRIRKQGDSLVLSPVRPDWTSFFAGEGEVFDDFLVDREDSPPQSREAL